MCGRTKEFFSGFQGVLEAIKQRDLAKAARQG
jgi:hypothetical protein